MDLAGSAGGAGSLGAVAAANPYAAGAMAIGSALSGAGSGPSNATATQDYGSLGLSDKRVTVGNTGLNLGAILLPFQENQANGGMGLQLTSRWLDKNYSVEGAASSIPTVGGGMGDAMAPYVVPVAVGVGALVLLAVLMRKRA